MWWLAEGLAMGVLYRVHLQARQALGVSGSGPSIRQSARVVTSKGAQRLWGSVYSRPCKNWSTSALA